MCIIVYKPKGIELPSEEVLMNCFDSNSDGAGYMYTRKGEVIIKKGFMKWDDFKANFDKTCKCIDVKNTPMVMHFRITTQGGVKQELCHPYPLSRKMESLKLLNTTADIGVAHNGIISLTSDHNKDYNDTMKFITDYLSLIIRDKKFYKDEDKLTLIERLCGSKLAILDGSGHCQLIGDFIEDNGVYYSNSSYKTYKYYGYKSYNWADLDDVCDICGCRLNWKDAIYDVNDKCYCEDCYSAKYGNSKAYSVYDNENIYTYYDRYYDLNTRECDFSELDGDCPLDDGLCDYCQICKKRNDCSKTMSNISFVEDFECEDGTLLSPTSEFFRMDGLLYGVSIDEEGNEWWVTYDEEEGYTMPVDAFRV